MDTKEALITLITADLPSLNIEQLKKVHRLIDNTVFDNQRGRLKVATVADTLKAASQVGRNSIALTPKELSQAALIVDPEPIELCAVDIIKKFEADHLYGCMVLTILNAEGLNRAITFCRQDEFDGAILIGMKTVEIRLFQNGVGSYNKHSIEDALYSLEKLLSKITTQTKGK